MKIKIKILITALLCLVCIIPALAVFAKENDYSVKEAEGFTIAYANSDMSAVADIMGITEKQLKAMCRENNALFVAVNSDNSVEVRLSRYETALSKKAGDISALSDSLLGELLGFEDDAYIKTKIGSTTFLKVEDVLADEGGKYTSQQYITIKNGYVYQISAYIADSAENQTAENFISGIKVIGATIYSPKQKLLVAVMIAAFVLLIVIMIRGIIKDVRGA